MVDLASTLTNTLILLGTASFMIIIAYFAANFSYAKLTLHKGLIAKAVIGTVLGLLAIYATVMAVKLPDGTIPNVRELGAMMAGVAGGPVAGVIAGLIGGIHRYSLGGVTAVPCALATFLVGAISGVVSLKLMGKRYLLKGALLGLVLESGALGLVFVFVPYDTALSIVSQVFVPMIAANTIGLVFWMYLFNRWRAQH